MFNLLVEVSVHVAHHVKCTSGFGRLDLYKVPDLGRINTAWLPEPVRDVVGSDPRLVHERDSCEHGAHEPDHHLGLGYRVQKERDECCVRVNRWVAQQRTKGLESGSDTEVVCVADVAHLDSVEVSPSEGLVQSPRVDVIKFEVYRVRTESRMELGEHPLQVVV